MNTVKKSQTFYSSRLPSLASTSASKSWDWHAILLYDKIFERQPKIKKWIERFERRYGVKSGEKLKSLDQFPRHMKKVLSLSSGLPTREITLVVLGGGSVGDFGGFIASVLKRGVRLVHVPSTWLAAVDSAHGGKNGLNIAKIKNQIGTFYPAHEIHLVREVLLGQPPQRTIEALGEIFKMGLIEGRSLWKQLHQAKTIDSNLYWRLLPDLVRAKSRVVNKDPFEAKGIRHILNLGHTLGHVWESKLRMPHGVAVLFGVAFALEWSLHRKILSSKNYYRIRLSEVGSYLPDRMELESLLRRTKNPQKLLLQDKKMSSRGKIRFVFIEAPGKTVIQSVSLEELAQEMKRQAL